jgi:hypothetical protein
MTRTLHRRKFLKDGATATLGLALFPFPRIWGEPSFDLVIRGGTIVDGTGGPAWRGDLGLVGEVNSVGGIVNLSQVPADLANESECKQVWRLPVPS